MSLTIRAQQMDAFRVDRLAQFIDRTVQHLRNRFSLETSIYDDAALTTLVRNAIERGRNLDVTSAFDLQRFAECVLLYGLEFPYGPKTRWAADILERKNISGRQKMTAISHYETFVERSPG